MAARLQRRCGTIVVACAVISGTVAGANAQVTTVIHGLVLDVQDAAVPGATVTLRQPSSGLERVAVTDSAGHFDLPNLPTGTHDLTATLDGFTPSSQRVVAATGAPVNLTLRLTVAALTDTVVVRPQQTAVDNTTSGTRHAVSVTRIERLPVAGASRGLEAVLVGFPGFAQNANGAIHPRGAHNQMTYVIDGLPISDQLTGAFANALDVGVVQTAELMTGNIPAEFGGKVSGVAVLGSRSGLGTGRASTGSVSLAGGGFGTAHGALQWGGERGRLGYFGSLTSMTTDRFLDQVSRDNLHNAGDVVRGFGRVDLRLTPRDTLRLHAMGGTSRFELANLRSQQAAGQDQRQHLADVSVWSAYLRPLGTSSTVDVTLGARTTSADLRPSAGDTPVTASQDRRLSTFTAQARYTRQAGRVGLRAGADAQAFPVRERFTMALTSATWNAPGSDGYNPALAAHDLTRGGRPFHFDDARTGAFVSAFAQSTVQAGNLTVNAGLRHDEYRFLVNGRQLQPRVGLSYRVGGRDLVLRASYNRNYQTPPNENLLLSNSEAAGALAPESVRAALGGATRAIRPERQDVAEAGAQFALGRRVTVDGAVYRKRSRDQQDNNNFFDTGIIFPTALARLRVTGVEARATLLPVRGLSGSLSVTSAHAIATPPFTGGLFLGQDAVDLLSAGPFPIDHDQRLSVHATAGLDPKGPWWLSATARYDSGLVANPSNPTEVAADPDFADLLPFVKLTATTPRVRPRTIVDLATGIDLATARGRRTWGLQAQVTNLLDRTALYNFQSVFVGTRVVQPRTASVRVTRYF